MRKKNNTCILEVVSLIEGEYGENILAKMYGRIKVINLPSTVKEGDTIVISTTWDSLGGDWNQYVRTIPKSLSFVG